MTVTDWNLKIGFVNFVNETLQGGTIYWGRSDINRQPTPATATFTILNPVGQAIDPDICVGQPIWAWVGSGTSIGNHRTRFYGSIVDVQIDKYTYTISAVSPLARLTQEEFGYAYGPIEGPIYQMYLVNNGQNISTFLGGATYQLNLNIDTGEGQSSWWYDEGTYKLWDFATAFTAGEPSGVLGEDWLNAWWPTNYVHEVRFTDATARRKTVPDLTLADNEIVQNWRIQQQVSDKINTCTVSAYQNDYFGWPAANTLFTATSDVSAYGAYGASVAANYSDSGTIRKVGTTLVGLQTNPTYRLRQITIPMSTLTSTRRNQILDALKLSNLVEIPELVPGFPTLYFIEGSNETVSHPDRWTLDLYLSEASLTHPPDRWTDADPTMRWLDVQEGAWGESYKWRFS